MSEDVKLSTPRLHVILEDGRTFDVQARNKDLVLWDRESTRRGWPGAEKAPFVWMTFLAWRCLIREGAVPETLTLSAFEDLALEVSSEKEAVEVVPTLPGVTPE